MLKGLEISVINYSVYKKTYRNRLDSEYYKKEYLINESYLNGIEINNFCTTKKIRNIKSFELEKDFNYLTISDINNLDYSTNSISFDSIPDRATYHLQHNDIAVSTVRPNRNAVALIKNPHRLVGTSGFTILRTKDTIDSNFPNTKSNYY